MIGLYKGTSPISRIIRWRTWSDYSHAAWLEETEPYKYEVYEAWQNGGVQHHQDYHSSNHKPGTLIDLFRVDMTMDQHFRAIGFLKCEIGKKYDFRGVLKFITRTGGQDQGAWFCSELIMAACLWVDCPLLCRVEPWKVDPGMLRLSPKLEFVCQLRV